MVLNTNHYYTSTHVLVVRADSDLASVARLTDPALQASVWGWLPGRRDNACRAAWHDETGETL